MSHSSTIFQRAAVLTPKRSGYDLSNENLFTTKCGTLTPCYVEEVIGNTNISVNTQLSVTLPPLATDFFGRVDAVVEFFFCPYRLLYGGFTKWYSQTNDTKQPNTGFDGPLAHGMSGSVGTVDNAIPSLPTSQPPVSPSLPSHRLIDSVARTFAKSGSLLDYLGVKSNGTMAFPTVDFGNWMPILAYHKIWEDYYRRPMLEAPAFVEPDGTQTSANELKYVRYWPFVRWRSATPRATITDPDDASIELNDGVNLFDLRQRHYAYDYFTSALPTPNGSNSVSEVTVNTLGNTTDNNTSFSISALRAANTLAMWMDRQNVTGWKYRDNAFARTGVMPPELCTQPLYLGRIVTPVYNNSIKTTANSERVGFDEGGNPTGFYNSNQQPWSGAGTRVASPTANGGDYCVKNFLAKELGVVMGIFSLVPHAYYSSGTRRYLTHSTITDFPDALLQNAGMQRICRGELTPNLSSETFGWTIPYAEALYHDDEVHGLFNDNGTLKNFAIKRGFDPNSSPIINGAFCRIPTTALDEVCATDAKISQYGCMVDMYHKVGIVTPLAGYVVPTLGTPDFMKRATVQRGGTDLC